jgi:hypothetical protein
LNDVWPDFVKKTTPYSKSNLEEQSVAMSDDSIEQEPRSPDVGKPETEGASADAIPSTGEAFKEIIGAAKQAARSARVDATKAGKRAVPIAAKAARQGAYDIAYGVSFVTAFGLGLVSRLAPDSLKTGVCEGGVAGKKAAQDLGKRSQEENESNTSNEASPLVPSAPDGSASTASA